MKILKAFWGLPDETILGSALTVAVLVMVIFI